MIHDSRDAPQSEAIILPAAQAERPLSPEAAEMAEAAEVQDLIERVWGGACTLPLDYRLVEAAALSTESRSLLDHAGSMTLRLESYWRETLRLRVLSSQNKGDYLVRLVLLEGVRSGVIRQLAALRLRLSALPAHLQQQVQEGTVPLGRLLCDAGIEFRPARLAFIDARCPALSSLNTRLEPGSRLPGRLSRLLLHPSDAVLGESVEMLPLGPAPHP
jgi:chorismate-pyruvate lyase